ncbi:MAG: PqqD family protein [Proteobacteria bacterium]|nr:PqqD family protein [Pseudomonadota bacterium]
MFDPTTIVKRSDRQVAANLDGEVAILDLEKGLYFGLQDVGAHVWEALQKPRSVDELCSTVLAHFDVEPEVCRTDLMKFLTSLHEIGLIEVVAPRGERLHP